MEIYSVGGSVRDALLGRPVTDRDYVVVGARPEDLLALGYKPVGKDFPVFLHPETHAEYALARTEKKHGRGYHGFVFYTGQDVKLEEDLARRDLTINAMAQTADGRLIDPFNGQADLKNKVLRHVGPAFAEDPVRLLRLARFAARFSDFSIAPETNALMRDMVEAGEINHLVPERVWQEIARGLMETRPDRMIEALRESGALQRLLPEVDALFGIPERADYHPEGDSGAHLLLALNAAARMGLTLAGRFAALTHDLGKATTPPEILPHHYEHEARGEAPLLQLSDRLKIPADCRDLALLTIRLHGKIHNVCGATPLKPGTMVETLEACDFRRRPERFEEILRVCEADSRGRQGYEDAPYPQAAIWRAAAAACRSVNDAAIAALVKDKANIPARLREARIAAVRAVLPQTT
ncbi:MAG: multifunctional CCA addition/repair protein [Zoogloeaceae bacterium]|jgi:tRNA nucleotidyltransferase (CCA-adding enzyme)|nr:multifunctional CCA addition/repair protein [Zoogloeaceae bacterium]